MTAASSRILVVEDDPSLREAMVEFLAGHGLTVAGVSDGVWADQRLTAERFDLVVLDLMLPGEDGLSICKRLASKGPPVLMVSAVGGTTDRIVGLECGAADYLSKPFEPRELLARIRAILRRRAAELPPVGGRLRFGEFAYDRAAASLSRSDGTLVSLTGGDLRLLAAFLERPGRLLSRAVLLDLTHDGMTEPFDRAIDLGVSRLRRKLTQAGQPDCIETVRGLGYRFIAPVRG